MAAINEIIYVRFQAPDLDVMERFLIDFGMQRSARTNTALYMRGASENHHIHITEFGDVAKGLGIGLGVKSRKDLEEISAQAGVPVEQSDEPGGGMQVALTDPNGFRVNVIYGMKPLEKLPVRSPLIINNAFEANRNGLYQRPKKGPSHVIRVEHGVLAGPNLEESRHFYQNLLGMKLSDEICASSSTDVIALFLHCGLGVQFTDHHSVALMQMPETGIDHCGFVTLDWDDLMLGHQHLKVAGHNHEWGIGRHILGSEIFDYWRDPFGHKLEHCTDGDLVNDDHQPSRVSIDDDILSIWSPPISSTFGDIATLGGGKAHEPT